MSLLLQLFKFFRRAQPKQTPSTPHLTRGTSVRIRSTNGPDFAFGDVNYCNPIQETYAVLIVAGSRNGKQLTVGSVEHFHRSIVESM